ncbi:MAG: putative lipopolysaccharide heptosyltransferase III [Nitrospirales bacterium]
MESLTLNTSVSFQNILVIKLRYIGDVILSTPVLRILRQEYAEARITCLVNSGTEEVLTNNPHVDEVLVVPRDSLATQLSFCQKLRARKFDCVIDLTDGDRSAVLTKVTGASVRIGFNREGRWRGNLYSTCVSEKKDMHAVDYHLLAIKFLGIQSDVTHPAVFPSVRDIHKANIRLKQNDLESVRWVMIHPTARYWFKAWSPERFAELSDQLTEQGLQVVLVGSTVDQAVGHKIQGIAKKRIFSFMGQTQLLELAALMKHAVLFIGNDGGPMHMAAAVGCPVLGLFGPTNPEVWGPRGAKTSVIYKGLDCRECFYPGCTRGEESCMKQISVEEVYSAALRLLKR